ncbi:MAG: hypothetical protein [Malazfec virus 6]
MVHWTRHPSLGVHDRGNDERSPLSCSGVLGAAQQAPNQFN